MSAIVQFVGGLSVFAGLAGLAYAIFAALNFWPTSAFLSVQVALGAIVSGAVLYCFGAIDDNLVAIRTLQEKQNSMIDERLPRNRS